MNDQERYQLYLAGREWGLLREAVRKRCKGICERCHFHPLSHVHHLTYIRKYQERPEDLQGLCEGCHKFVHGRSDRDPLASAPVMVAGRPVRSVYLAGKIGPDDWRHSIVDHPPDDLCDLALHPAYHWSDLPESISLPSGQRLDFTGPFFTSVEHGGIAFSEPHACPDAVISPRYSVVDECRQAIRRSDLLFAWIDTQDCFGTLIEIGFASALNKVILIASPGPFVHLWFAYTLAHRVVFGIGHARTAFHSLMNGGGDPFEHVNRTWFGGHGGSLMEEGYHDLEPDPDTVPSTGECDGTF